MATVTFENATRVYPGSSRPAVDSFSLTIKDAELLVLVGPSGSGKSTTLRMLAGLEELTSGSIRLGERDVADVAAKDRDIAMVFQNYALYPHMTVAENMGFALKIAGVPKEERAARVLEAARILDLEEYLARKPKALSGGQRQRVAMGRAIVRQPRVFLMDEPLANLDAKLRVQTRRQIASLQRKLGITTVYVTHDQAEAITMGDRIAVMKDGVLQQVGNPRELLDAPANVFVAGFIGAPTMNLFATELGDDGVRIGSATVPLPPKAIAAAGGPRVTVGVRPDDLEVDTVGEGLMVEVDSIDEDGDHSYLSGHATVGDERVEVVARVDDLEHPLVGERVVVRPRPHRVHVFHAETGERLVPPVAE